jgi:hypothetical protein
LLDVDQVELTGVALESLYWLFLIYWSAVERRSPIKVLIPFEKEINPKPKLMLYETLSSHWSEYVRTSCYSQF